MLGVVGGGRQSIDDLDIEAWHDALTANTIGPILVARAFKQNLVASGAGNLMILSSQLGASTWPFGGMYIYSTTKARKDFYVASSVQTSTRIQVSILRHSPN